MVSFEQDIQTAVLYLGKLNVPGIMHCVMQFHHIPGVEDIVHSCICVVRIHILMSVLLQSTDQRGVDLLGFMAEDCKYMSQIQVYLALFLLATWWSSVR